MSCRDGDRTRQKGIERETTITSRGEEEKLKERLTGLLEKRGILGVIGRSE